ncbi:MAG: molybdenum cofactor cytidylyltransferase [Dehalococcoidia bacterium]|nr:molybdenum cofactor cytidylyltransferase [Dehalococcoidia bacterium]
MVSAILLAAGESKRMGKPKQLMPLGNSTIVEQTIDNLLNSKVSEVILVLGYRAKELMKRVATKPVKIVVNPIYHQGMGTSIVAGLNLVDSRAQAVMLALGDQPFVDSQTINRLIEEFDNHDKGIAIPVYQGRRGHPIIFSIKYKAQLSGLKGDIGGRDIIKEHPEDIHEVAVSCEGIQIDIDTISNYSLQEGGNNSDTQFLDT